MNLGHLGRVENLQIINFSASTEMMSLYSPSTSTRAPPQSIVDAKSWDRILFTRKKKLSWDIFRRCDLKILKWSKKNITHPQSKRLSGNSLKGKILRCQVKQLSFQIFGIKRTSLRQCTRKKTSLPIKCNRRYHPLSYPVYKVPSRRAMTASTKNKP